MRPDGPVIVLVEEFGPADPLALMSLVSVDGERWSDHLATTFEEFQNAIMDFANQARA